MATTSTKAKKVVNPAGPKRNVILTAGHTGVKSGAWREWFDEGEETVILRDLVTKALNLKGLKVKNDSNHERTGNIIRWVNEQYDENDIFVELHFNAVDNPAPSGVECFVQRFASEFERSVANALCESVSGVLGIRNRGVKTPEYSQYASLGVLDRTKVQAVLFEVCFMSNRDDVAAYREKQAEVVKAIAQTIFNASKQ